jgi:surfeit locus 1 family protein
MTRHLSLILGSVVVLGMLGVLLSLGTWQIQRLHWKLGLIEQRQSALSALPIRLTFQDLSPEGLSALPDFRRVTVSGNLLNDHEFYLTAQFKGDQSGWHVITPLSLEGGGTVLIDRGFVPADHKSPATRAEGELSGTVTVIGILRRPHGPGTFTPANQPGDNIWFLIDPAAMGKAAGIETLANIFIDADASPNPGGFPVGGQTPTTLDNPHLQYAVTWYALAGLLSVVYLIYCRRYVIDYRKKVSAG